MTDEELREIGEKIIEGAFTIDFKLIHVDEHGDVVESFIKDLENALKQIQTQTARDCAELTKNFDWFNGGQTSMVQVLPAVANAIELKYKIGR